MADLLSLKESVLVYLDRSGGLRKLAEHSKAYTDPQLTEAVFRFHISVNPSDVLEVDPLLGDCVLHDPLKATQLFQSVCFLAIKTLSLVEKIQTESQVHVILKLTSLPPFPEYTLDLSSHHCSFGLMRPVCMEGLVLALTRVTKYTQGARFLCEDEDCPCSGGFQHIRVHAPGATESATVRNDFSCMNCGSQLKEDAKFRVLGGERKSLTVMDNLWLYVFFSSVYADELCNAMRMGRLYRVIGIPALVHQWPNITWSIEANNIQPWEPAPKDFPKINASFQQLLRDTAASPWWFSAILTHCFGLHVAPPGLYNTLKLSLLLSLVQSRANTEDTFHNLDVLAITTETLILSRLMMLSLSLSCRGVRHQPSGEMFASLSRDEHGAGTANIHAGSSLLATGGICMLGDLNSYKKDKLDSIQSVLENRTASVFIRGKKYGEDADEHVSFPVQCSFWAYTDTSCRSARADSLEIGPISTQLADAFGLVVQCKDMVGEQTPIAQTVHSLQQALQLGKPQYPSQWKFSTQDYQEVKKKKKFTNLQVETSPAAEKIIQGYYMAIRRIRSQSQGVNMSVASVKLLISLAEAHCKLCLRTVVKEEDAVIAVLLCENSVTLRHGASALLIPPDAVFPCDLGAVDGLHKRDTALDEFHQNILRFIYAFAPGSKMYITEE
uniref:Minichromosome maintenance domain-containing protein 2 n=1 Tax=Gouania willdenowi TaxID=441366 RepID=A0A8C5GQF6_GOUWI